MQAKFAKTLIAIATVAAATVAGQAAAARAGGVPVPSGWAAMVAMGEGVRPRQPRARGRFCSMICVISALASSSCLR